MGSSDPSPCPLHMSSFLSVILLSALSLQVTWTLTPELTHQASIEYVSYKNLVYIVWWPNPRSIVATDKVSLTCFLYLTLLGVIVFCLNALFWTAVITVWTIVGCVWMLRCPKQKLSRYIGQDLIGAPLMKKLFCVTFPKSIGIA